MSHVTAIIAEDEPLLAQSLQDDLQALWPELQVLGTARHGLQALAMIQQLRPDIAFLDIRMPAANGLEVATALAEDWDATSPPPLLVFVTAFDEFALDAFERAAIDYLLKPVQRPRLSMCLERVRRRLDERRQALAAQGDDPHAHPAASSLPVPGLGAPGPEATTGAGSASDAALRVLIDQLQQVMGSGAVSPALTGASTPPSAPGLAPLRRIQASVGDTVHIVPITDVCYLQATDKYVNVVTATAELLIREPLKDLIPRLDPQSFVQIHRSTVVNLAFVTAAVRDERGRTLVTLRGRSESLLVSRLHAHVFRPM